MSGIATAVVGAGLVGGYMSSKAQKGAASSAANAQLQASQEANALQREMWEQSRADTAGQRAMFGQAAPHLQRMATGPNQFASYERELRGLPMNNLPSTPRLQGQVNVDYANDPLLQAQRAEMERALNRRASAGGKMYSSDAENALIRNTMPLMQDAYGRALGDLERQNQNALAMYGLDYQRGQDMYSRQSGNIFDRYNMATRADDSQYGRLLDMAKIGSGAAHTAGQNAMSLGQGLASNQLYAGNAAAQGHLASGQANAQMWNQMGNIPMNYLAMNYMMGGGRGGAPQAQAPNTGYGIAPWHP